jgi:hypothetical protein
VYIYIYIYIHKAMKEMNETYRHCSFKQAYILTCRKKQVPLKTTLENGKLLLCAYMEIKGTKAIRWRSQHLGTRVIEDEVFVVSSRPTYHHNRVHIM